MTISPLLREKINVSIDKMGPDNSWPRFVVVDEGSGIVKLINIVQSIPLRTVPLLAD